jgi:hypothetical protein
MSFPLVASWVAGTIPEPHAIGLDLHQENGMCFWRSDAKKKGARMADALLHGIWKDQLAAINSAWATMTSACLIEAISTRRPL